MICAERLTINSQEFIKTYFDKYIIMRDDVECDEAIDPTKLGRVYAESTTLRQNLMGGEV